MSAGVVEQLWTVQDVADFLRVPVRTLYQWRYLGQGPKASKVGRFVRYDPAEVRAWVKGRESVGGER